MSLLLKARLLKLASRNMQNISDVQGFVNPHGYEGKGTWGKGRGQGIGTLTKPLPSTQVGGYPQLFGRVGVVGGRDFSQPGHDGQLSGQ